MSIKAKVVLFETVAFNMYGNVLPNVLQGKISGIYDYSSLRKPQEAIANHTNIYPTIPTAIQETVSDNYKDLTYINIKVDGLDDIELAIEWIIPSTYVKLNLRSINILLQDVDDNKVELLKAILVSEGFNPIITYL